MDANLKEVVAHSSIVGRSTSQKAPIVVGEVATPCCIHALKFSINIPSQLIHFTSHSLSA